MYSAQVLNPAIWQNYFTPQGFPMSAHHFPPTFDFLRLYYSHGHIHIFKSDLNIKIYYIVDTGSNTTLSDIRFNFLEYPTSIHH